MKASKCPFCGGEPEVVFVDEGKGRKWEVACNRGRACGVNVFCFGNTKAEAVEKWNRRSE